MGAIGKIAGGIGKAAGGLGKAAGGIGKALGGAAGGGGGGGGIANIAQDIIGKVSELAQSKGGEESKEGGGDDKAAKAMEIAQSILSSFTGG